MRELTPGLLAAQQKGSGSPYMKAEAVNRYAGSVRLDWERIYEGSEDENVHSLVMAGDGSIIRTRISLIADNRKLYVQRVIQPAPGSDFSSWNYAGIYNCVAVASVSNGAEVLVFVITSIRELKFITSMDYGETWTSPQTIDYVSLPYIDGFSAACKPNGDLALFFCIRELLYVKQRTGGAWQAKTYWDKTTGDLSGVSAVYDSDWELAVTGKDAGDNYKIWSLVYGDGGEVTAGTWSDLQEIASAPSDGDYEYRSVFMDKPDVYRFFYVEKFTGNEAYNRPFRSQSLPDTSFVKNLWTEPVPFDFLCEYGMALAHHGDYCWLSVPNGVWRAGLTETRVDLSGDIVFLKQDTEAFNDNVVIHMRNDAGQYASLPEPLAIGCRLDISPGYVTALGAEYSPGQSYTLEACEYVSEGGKAGLYLFGNGGWERINTWIASCQFRFNAATDETNVIEILEFILAKAGIKLEVISQSAVISGFYPDFTVHPGNSGNSVIRKLLSFVPDTIFIEGDTGYLIDPSDSNISVYSYGSDHPVIEARYRKASWKFNRITVEGYDAVGDNKLLKDTFAWEQINAQQVINKRAEDRNIGSISDASDRGVTALKYAEAESVNGSIDIPVNCGQQLFDVIDITDERAGLSAETKRVVQISLVYDTGRGEYRQRISLGAV